MWMLKKEIKFLKISIIRVSQRNVILEKLVRSAHNNVYRNTTLNLVNKVKNI